MFSKLTTTLAAGALVLATTVSPTVARAGNDRGKIIGGLALGAILGAVIASEIDDNKNRHRGHVSRGARNVYDGGYRYNDRRGRHRGYGRHDDDGYRRVALPGACRVHRGHRKGYSGRCLRGYNYSRHALPSACAIRVGGRHGTIYRDRCLNRYGYH